MSNRLFVGVKTSELVRRSEFIGKSTVLQALLTASDNVTEKKGNTV